MVTRSSLPVVPTEHPLELPIYSIFGGTEPVGPRVLIVAGIHGRENGGIVAAYALLERLVGVTDLHGVVDVLPVANPFGFAAEARENPVDGKNLGECFDPSRLHGGQFNRLSQSEAIASTLMSKLEGCSHLLDLHSAGEARYLPHALFFREEDAGSAAAAGLPFALLRRKNREGMTAGMLCSAARLMGIPALTLELGGGITIWPEDSAIAIRALLSLLAYWKFVPGEYASEATPPGKIFLRDIRCFLRASEEGAFYPSAVPGDRVQKNDRIGTWVSLPNLDIQPVAASEAGILVYLRSRCRAHTGDTMAMILPETTPQQKRLEN